MNAQRIAVFPGSFDPFTNGHADLVRRALPLFDHIIIGIGVNGEKQGFLPVEVRRQAVEACFTDEPKVQVEVFDTLTVDFCRKSEAGFILRGIRSCSDWEYERAIAAANKRIASGIETVFLPADATLECVSSSVVRELLRYGGEVSDFMPEEAAHVILPYLSQKH